MHIALFGASFDPPHAAHKIITEQLLEQKLADQVWLVPVKDHPFHKKLTSELHRLKMVEMMVSSMHNPEQVKIEKYELEQDKPSYSYDTITAMALKYPEHHFSWVIGSDNLAHYAEWHNAWELLNEFPMYVYPREGSNQEELYTGMRKISHVPEVAVSSTMIREKVAAGESITGLVEPEIAQYIKENELYVSKPNSN